LVAASAAGKKSRHNTLTPTVALRHMVVAVMLATCAWLAGCASLLGNAQRPVSHALADLSATPLGQMAARERFRDSGSNLSGSALLASPNMAFAARPSRCAK
jgi:hypothetical protein